MTVFRKLTDTMWVSPQITVADVAEARAQGASVIINNRPEGESDDQVPGSEIAAAAAAAGIAYFAIPVTHSGFSAAQLSSTRSAIDQAGGKPVLAYCRSGTRSTLLWALSEAQAGADPEELSRAAAAGGYDLGPIRALLDSLAASPG